VYFDGVLQTTGFTINTSTNKVVFASAPASAVVVLIQRTTPTGKSGFQTDVADFSDGSVLTAADLDQATLGLLYVAQEAQDQGSTNSISRDLTDNKWNAENLVIKSVGTPGQKSDATTKEYVDALKLYDNPTALDIYTLTGNGSTTEFVLTPYAQSSEAKSFFVDIAGVMKRPTTDYTIGADGNRITFAVAPADGAVVTVRNIGLTRDIVSSGSSITSTNGTTARTLADRYGEITNVKDYGAVGDGATDDRAAIQAAITDAVLQNTFAVYFPPGDYIVEAELDIPATDDTGTGHPFTLRMFGAGPGGKPNAVTGTNSIPVRDGATRLVFLADDSSDAAMITDAGGRLQLEDMSLINTPYNDPAVEYAHAATALKLMGTSSATADTLRSYRGARVSNVTFFGFLVGIDTTDGDCNGLTIDSCDFYEMTPSLGQGWGIIIGNESDGISITNCSFMANYSGISIGQSTSTTYSRNIRIAGCIFKEIKSVAAGTGGEGILLTKANDTLIERCSFYRSAAGANTGIRFFGGYDQRNITVRDCHFNGNHTASVTNTEPILIQGGDGDNKNILFENLYYEDCGDSGLIGVTGTPHPSNTITIRNCENDTGAVGDGGYIADAVTLAASRYAGVMLTKGIIAAGMITLADDSRTVASSFNTTSVVRTADVTTVVTIAHAAASTDYLVLLTGTYAHTTTAELTYEVNSATQFTITHWDEDTPTGKKISYLVLEF